MISLFLLVRVGNPIKLWRDETEPDQLCSSYLYLLAESRRTNCYLPTTNLSKFNLGSLCLWFYETLMYIKLRESRAQLNLFGEVTNTSISEAFKCSRPQAFNLEDQVCSENQAWSIDVSAPVWECRRLLPNLLRQRTRKQNESNDPSSFKFGSWENQVAALKLIDMNSFRGEILKSEATGNGSIEEEEVKDRTRPRKVTKMI